MIDTRAFGLRGAEHGYLLFHDRRHDEKKHLSISLPRNRENRGLLYVMYGNQNLGVSREIDVYRAQ